MDNCKFCGKDHRFLAPSLTCLQSQLDEARPFMVAVKKRHNGYDPNNELCPEPESPEQALQDLQDTWDRMEDRYVETQVKLQAELDRINKWINYLSMAARVENNTAKQRLIEAIKQAKNLSDILPPTENTGERSDH